REPLGPEAGEGRLRHLRRHLVPGVSGDRLPVPPARELREAEQLRRAEEQHPSRAARAISAQPQRRSLRRARVGVLLQVPGRTADQAATNLAGRLQTAAVGMLPRFDTGYWSLYSLGGAEAPLDYHQYVVRLLGILSKRTQDPTLTTYAQRFGDDLRQPPVVKEGAAPGAIYPWPQDGYRDSARYVFWVSKRSTVRLQIDHAGSPVVVPRGWHAVLWSPGRIQAGIYTPNLHAVDVVGNASDTDLPPVEVRRDTQAPKINASLAARRLYWR